MPHKTAVILRAADIDRAEIPLVQRLNPRSRFSDAWLARLAGLERIGLSRGRIPPGGESFAYHAHQAEEEWLFIVSGRARARIDGKDHELGPGDFAAFPTPQAPHLLTNPFGEDCVYLMGGERGLVTDVLAYPDLGKSYVLVREPARTAFHELGPAEYPFGRRRSTRRGDRAAVARDRQSRLRLGDRRGGARARRAAVRSRGGRLHASRVRRAIVCSRRTRSARCRPWSCPTAR